MPITRSPSPRFSSRHWPTRGRLSLQIPQLTDQKWTRVGCPATSASAWACVPPNHSVAPSSRGIAVPIFIAIVASHLTTDYTEHFLCNLWFLVSYEFKVFWPGFHSAWQSPPV